LESSPKGSSGCSALSSGRRSEQNTICERGISVQCRGARARSTHVCRDGARLQVLLSASCVHSSSLLLAGSGFGYLDGGLRGARGRGRLVSLGGGVEGRLGLSAQRAPLRAQQLCANDAVSSRRLPAREHSWWWPHLRHVRK
jgi:hypothetical protein